MSKVIIISGCSTGIGRDLVRQLAGSGHTVVATARKVETLADLPAAMKLPLDVTQPESVDNAVACTLQRFGRIDVLVNNAGYAIRGAVEEVPIEQVEQVFDANVFGALRMVRAVLPQMRKQRSGRIINLSSISGRLSTPVNGTYSASKFAIEALSDALRWELAPFGIQVVLIEPGPIRTSFGEKAKSLAQTILSNPVSPYLPMYRQSQEVDASMQRQQPGPEAVSRVVQQAVEAPRPKARYLAGIDFPGWLVLHLGSSVWDLAVRRMFRI